MTSVEAARGEGHVDPARTAVAVETPGVERPADAQRGEPHVEPFSAPRIEMAHGAGGIASRRLIETLIAPLAGLPAGATCRDAALLTIDGARIAVTADSFVVRPLRFPGGSIGDLAVNGTVNDLAVAGARPIALLSTLIIESGCASHVLAAEMRAIGAAACRAGVRVIGGDTKVVEPGKADGLYITTCGIGQPDPRLNLSADRVRPGDRVILSGPIGDHGITILLARGELDLEADLTSDTASVWPLVDAMAARGLDVRWLRDPTRGGVATALTELARDAEVGVLLDEDALPVRDSVRGACELLGLDPLHIANEGRFVGIVGAACADEAIEALRRTPGGEDAAIVGTIAADPARVVVCRSSYGGARVVDMLVGDPLPRIC